MAPPVVPGRLRHWEDISARVGETTCPVACVLARPRRRAVGRAMADVLEVGERSSSTGGIRGTGPSWVAGVDGHVQATESRSADSAMASESAERATSEVKKVGPPRTAGGLSPERVWVNGSRGTTCCTEGMRASCTDCDGGGVLEDVVSGGGRRSCLLDNDANTATAAAISDAMVDTLPEIADEVATAAAGTSDPGTKAGRAEVGDGGAEVDVLLE